MKATQTCDVQGCNKPNKKDARMCSMHVARVRKTGTTAPPKASHAPAEVRFWRFVPAAGPDECWEWQGGREPRGYGIFWNGQKSVKAPRQSYMLSVGPIPDGFVVRHSCDNPPCVNPGHLSVGTPTDNAQDMWTRERARLFTTRRGRKLTATDVLAIREAAASGTDWADLAATYGVERRSISQVVRRITWKHL